ncbi:restriction endonuclease subunit S [Vibrio lentus]|uniref:restriction endonuclease subunit S n=1 Tax=Vibrio lentus TaxID=136468 RepID=UPI000C857677|nr:restriction endonuclease subunit S [Vibrio lentus]PMM19497.1 hypothetical protein BCT58_19765 [Vibrio lentus]
MTEQMNVPKLRFGEFDKEWALNKAKINIVAGNAYKLDEYTDNGYLLIQGLHIQPDRIVLEDKPKYVKQSDGKHVKIDKGDIVLGLNRPITNNQLKASRFKLDAESVLYQRAGKLSFDISKLDSEFIYQYLKCSTFMKQLDLELIGSDQPYIRSNLFQATKNVFPLLDEQQKIASFLSKVDENIGLLSEKKDKLTEYKRGVMQQLFNGKWHEQDGLLTFVPPTLRFKADDGSEFPDWKEKMLGELGQFKNGLNKGKEDFGFGKPFVNLQDVFGQQTLGTPNNFGLVNANDKDIKTYQLLKGDVIFIRSSVKKSGVGETVLVSEDLVDTVYSGFLIRFRSKPCLIDGFKKYCFWDQKFRNRLIALSTTSANTNINQESLSQLAIQYPSQEEQTKIASFLSAIDQKIALTNSELNKAKEWKKGLLQQMFV